jgi:hypothetical protein
MGISSFNGDSPWFKLRIAVFLGFWDWMLRRWKMATSPKYGWSFAGKTMEKTQHLGI